MKIKNICNFLEEIAPLSLQESYDNAGLLAGNAQWECTGAIVCLDVTEAVIQEAIDKKYNLVIAHHPLIFKGLKKITGKNFVENCLIKSIKNDIAIYAIHTNLDNVIKGVNAKITEKLSLENCATLIPKASLLKVLAVYVPVAAEEKLKEGLFKAGAGSIGNYSECGFSFLGEGSFLPGAAANPVIGERGIRHTDIEKKLEVIYPAWLEQKIVKAMKENHPYEEVAYHIYALDNTYQDAGTGMYGTLAVALEETVFLDLLQNKFGTPCLKHSPLTHKKISKVGVCGGAGSFAIKDAINCGCDVYVTSDLKYHDFFEADGKILLVDIGHYESEQFTQDLLVELLKQKFLNFAVLKTGVNSNPVHYYQGN